MSLSKRVGKSIGCAAAVAGILMCSTFARAQDMSPSDNNSKQILSNIHTVNQNEIKMAKLALQKSQSSEVKSYAKKMIQDHTAADAKVMALAKTEGLSLSKNPMSPKEQNQLQELSTASGPKFDKAYMEVNEKAHDQAISMLKNSEKQATDPKVKQLIGQLLPTVQHHEHMAKQIQSTVEGATS